jgi:hypothetical protein
MLKVLRVIFVVGVILVLVWNVLYVGLESRWGEL